MHIVFNDGLTEFPARKPYVKLYASTLTERCMSYMAVSI